MDGFAGFFAVELSLWFLTEVVIKFCRHMMKRFMRL